MHRELDHMIGFLPDAEEFLSSLRRMGKRVTILTNAHRAGVDVKTAKTGLDRQVDRIVDAFEVGWLKMRSEYWPTCRDLVGFDPARALYVDDDEQCLAAAEDFGIGRIFHRSQVELSSFSGAFRAVYLHRTFPRDPARVKSRSRATGPACAFPGGVLRDGIEQLAEFLCQFSGEKRLLNEAGARFREKRRQHAALRVSRHKEHP
jgi:hypothetical protein